MGTGPCEHAYWCTLPCGSLKLPSGCLQGDALVLCSWLAGMSALASEPPVLRGKSGPGMASSLWRLDATSERGSPALVCHGPAHLLLVGLQPTAAAWPRGTSPFDACSCSMGCSYSGNGPAPRALLTDSGLSVHPRSSSPTSRTSWKSIRISWLPWSTAYTLNLSLSTNLGMSS